MKGCVSGNVNVPQWGELCNGSLTPEQLPHLKKFVTPNLKYFAILPLQVDQISKVH